MHDRYLEFMRVGRAIQRELNIPPGALEEGLAIVRGALTDDWILEALTERTRRKPSLRQFANDHRIAECLQATGRSQVIELLELAAYLKALANVPKLELVLAQLKEDYDHAFLQLSIAYRLRAVGHTVVEFEPPTSDGQYGDILCSDSRRMFVVECYCPMYAFHDREYELEALASDLDRFRSCPVRVDVRARERISPAHRKHIGGFLRSIDPTSSGPWTLDREFAHVNVTRISPRIGTTPSDEVLPLECADASWILEVVIADEADAKDMAIRDNYERERLSQLRVWMSPDAETDAAEDPHSTLAKKVSRKLTQARGRQDIGRVVVAKVLGVEERDENVSRLADDLASDLRRRHDRWNGVFLVNRRWLPTGRYMHFGVYVLGSQQPLFDDKSFTRLGLWEERADILADLGD